MREILFRGKRIDNSEWVEGSLLKVTIKNKIYHLIFEDSFSFDGKNVKALLHGWVAPETVGQYTGLTDKNGKKIFEGDIVQSWLPAECGVVEFHTKNIASCGCCYDHFVGSGFAAFEYDLEDGAVIVGNIHDNPELLKGGAE